MKILLMYAPSPEHQAALKAAAPQAEFLHARSEAEAQALIVDADAVLGNRYFLQSLPFARQLRWMQSNSVGVDRILQAREKLAGITLTCAKGVYDGEMADHALALILALVRGFPQAWQDRQKKTWRRYPLQTMAGLRVMILGWGGVGRALGAHLQALGAHVTGVRRSLAQPEITSTGPNLLGPDHWRAALPAMDGLAIVLPLTSSTYHIVGVEELALLPPHAWVVNVGRGPTLDQSALLGAVQSGSLSGAGLDVFEEEPLPPVQPLWDEPRILITPHVARSLEHPPYRWENLFVENVRRFAAGMLLLNIVDQETGY